MQPELREELTDFLTRQADYLDGEAEEIDGIGDREARGGGNLIAVAYARGAAEGLRATSSAFRRAINEEVVV